jgi:ubiquinone/menaquinone biosynthesis C-methylase UbiE
MLEKDLLTQVDSKVVERYSNRLRQFGLDPRTLGWDRRESQFVRFGVASQAFSFAGRSVLDLGCGLADFHEHLYQDATSAPASYTGVDINPDLVDVCRRRFPNASFDVRNILHNPYSAERWDVVTLFGLLNLRFSEFSNETYARQFITEAFRLCNQAVIVDMLSNRTDAGYPREGFVYYYEPAEMLDFAFSLTPHVTLRHDYRSIPQREFMLVLRREPCA